MFRFLFLIGCFVFLGYLSNGYSAEDCLCPEAQCSQCEEQVRLEFFTERCPDKIHVKSCKRPICKPKDPLPDECSASVGSKNSQSVNYVNKVEERRPASVDAVVAPEVKEDSIGVIAIVHGEAWVISIGNKKEIAVIGKKVYPKDILETGEDGKLKIVFKDKNILALTPKSKVQLSEYSFSPNLQKGKSLLNLIYGKIRNSVTQKYDDTDRSYYRVKTATAVAGIRGTDFFTGFEKAQTEVAALEGTVQLASRNGKHQATVGAGQKVTYVVPIEADDATSADNRVFDENDLKKFEAKGYMTPVYNMSAAEIDKLIAMTSINSTRKVDSVNVEYICQKPKGNMNDCSWTCEHNPEGARSCRTDIQGVSCVRRRCNANGIWAEETRLPASYFDACDSQQIKVGPCNY